MVDALYLLGPRDMGGAVGIHCVLKVWTAGGSKRGKRSGRREHFFSEAAPAALLRCRASSGQQPPQPLLTGSRWPGTRPRASRGGRWPPRVPAGCSACASAPPPLQGGLQGMDSSTHTGGCLASVQTAAPHSHKPPYYNRRPITTPALTILAGAQPATRELEERGANLDQQKVGVAVLVDNQHAVHAAPHALALVPRERGRPEDGTGRGEGLGRLRLLLIPILACSLLLQKAHALPHAGPKPASLPCLPQTSPLLTSPSAAPCAAPRCCPSQTWGAWCQRCKRRGGTA